MVEGIGALEVRDMTVIWVGSMSLYMRGWERGAPGCGVEPGD